MKTIVFQLAYQVIGTSDLVFSDISPTDLQDDIIGPIIIDKYREQVTKEWKMVDISVF